VRVKRGRVLVHPRPNPPGTRAEPVEISGEVERQGELLILRADPSTYRRVKG